ncbi:DUF7344 domain-containing protein [Halorubrum sp. DTA98]|uniref:DUF7344 domain-containing protein n=1 Tax=Halorubrum sp. DTA98 TaxID=3402163 RepID=UPI003AAB1ADB
MRPSDDGLYRALAAARRRLLLYYLIDADERTVEELATVLAGREATETGTARTRDDRDRLRVRLVHSDLPFLDECGLVAYDRQDATVTLEPLDPFVAELVRRSVDRSSRSSR